MVIKNISIKNFKSFGNDPQSLELPDKGNLFLLSGRNGAGKSSIIDSFDYCFFNKVKGRKQKKVKLSSLANRTNGNMEVKVNFKTEKQDDISVVRGYNPSKLKLYENGVENLTAGKDKLNQLIEKYVGLDHDTFKGFISMSINDFKNFISLSNEEKKLLLDKMFNLEVINELNKILNDFIRNNKKDIEVLDKEIEVLNNNINSLDKNIKQVKESKNQNFENKINELKEKISSLKPSYEKLTENIEEIKSKKSSVEEKITELRTQLTEYKSEVKQIDKQLKLFENDKCPTCHSSLNTDHHKGIKESFEDKKSEFNKLIEEITTKGKKLSERKKKLEEIFDKNSSKLTDIKSTLTSYNREIKTLQKEKQEEKDDDVQSFIDTMEEYKKKVKKTENKKSKNKDKEHYHKYIKNILSEEGVKKTIIESIIDPINSYIEENLEKMHLPFEVELDNKFTSYITCFGEEIDVDTLSTGENKAINIAIMLAYLKLIRTKRQINILFLDEVFSSIDVERVNDVIGLLRDLADNSKINIFLVHHSILDSQHFDKIYSIEKDVFSYIKTIETQ